MFYGSRAVEEIARQFAAGDICPAVVVALNPLVVGVHVANGDCAVLLTFPAWVLRDVELSLGERLIASVMYRPKSSEAAGDLYFNPAEPRPYGNIVPYVADFLVENRDALFTHKQRISAAAWATCRERVLALHKSGAFPPRDGSPLLCSRPSGHSDSEFAAQPAGWWERIPARIRISLFVIGCLALVYTKWQKIERLKTNLKLKPEQWSTCVVLFLLAALAGLVVYRRVRSWFAK